MFGDFSIHGNKNVSDVRQTAVNNLANTFEGTCSSSQISATNNNFVYVTDTNIGGNFYGITNKTDNKLSCTLSNMAKMATYNRPGPDSEYSSNHNSCSDDHGGGSVGRILCHEVRTESDLQAGSL